MRPVASILVVCLIGQILACNQIKDPVRIESGLISGVPGSDLSVRVYKGIPFAAPPVGDLRWRPPQPASDWDGVRMADQYGAACMQVQAGSRLPWTEEFMHQGEVSEDCLNLNVWTPATSTKETRPVMVYIYGGGFSEGSNAIAAYDGEELAKKGVVLVSINYRVGLPGFYVHPALSAESERGSSGNYGLLDQVAALQWVQNNIDAFGGDPSQVTIFGQSAGAMSVAYLLQTPLAKGLFARAIIQSGPGLFSSSIQGSGTTLVQAEEEGVRFAEMKEAASLDDLRTLASDELLGGQGVPRFGAVMDGYYFTGQNQYDSGVPVMNGFTADDMGTGGGFGPPPENSVAAFEAEARQRFGETADDYLALYAPLSDESVPALRKTSGRDRARVSLKLWAAEMAALGVQVYTYYFDRAIPWPEHPEFGAFHTGEVAYVFNNLKMLDRPWEDIDSTVADQVSSYWVNFAKTGDPNGPGLPEWPAFNATSNVTMELGATTGSMPITDQEKVVFWTTDLTRPPGE